MESPSGMIKISARPIHSLSTFNVQLNRILHAKFYPQRLWNVEKISVDKFAEKSIPQSLLKSY